MDKVHHYEVSIKWTGNEGTGTSSYRAYSRSHTITVSGKQEISGSSDPAFRGDSTKYNPEELLVASLSSCHMLWYLHLCAEAGLIVLEYTDRATGIMQENKRGGGQFREVMLKPSVVVAEASMIAKANALHKEANELCFIANSVNFPVLHQPDCNTRNTSSGTQ